jgi:hypothetical protein
MVENAVASISNLLAARLQNHRVKAGVLHKTHNLAEYGWRKRQPGYETAKSASRWHTRAGMDAIRSTPPQVSRLGEADSWRSWWPDCPHRSVSIVTTYNP